MRVNFVRTGGFAGLRLEAVVDSDSLPEEEARLLKTELDNACFFDLPSKLTSRSGGADRFQYEITVEDGNTQHTIETGETAIPEPLLPFIQHVEILARSTRR